MKGLELDHHLYRFAVVHRAIAVGDSIQIRHAVEHATRLDPALHHVRHQLLDVSPHRSRPARDRNILEEAVVSRWNLFILRHADSTDCSAWPSDADGSAHRFLETDALEN